MLAHYSLTPTTAAPPLLDSIRPRGMFLLVSLVVVVVVVQVVLLVCHSSELELLSM